jgi:D-alanyl-lipoteichoic acid acyltransferase DltB (MBOAT superfamily)
LLDARFRILFLVLISCIFISGQSIVLLIYIIGYALVNFFIGKQIQGSKFPKFFYRTGIFINLAQILLIKYSSFTVDPFISIFKENIHLSQKLSSIIIPIGISFFTLQGIGYLINIYKGWEKPEKNFFHFFLYIAFYPKFLSGPIERSNKFLPQLTKDASFNSENVSQGLKIALFGFFKKVVIADELGLVVLNSYNNLDTSGSLMLWSIVIIQPLYLYFDFTGYTDIAIGLGKAFGISLTPNFNRPFFSENVTTFWKRFHMSLSSWFNDYLFRQISFKYRHWGNLSAVIAVFITFTLFGIWHGAGWNFMVLGFLQALAINYEFFTRQQRIKALGFIKGSLRIWISRLITYCFYGISLIFFFSPNLASSLNFLEKLFINEGSFNLGISRIEFLFAMSLAAIFMIIELINNDYQKQGIVIENVWKRNRIIRLIIYNIVALLIVYFNNLNTPFVYQQF